MARKYFGSTVVFEARLKTLGFAIKSVRKLRHGNQYSAECGAKATLFNNGTLQFQGVDPEKIARRWDSTPFRGGAEDVK